MKMPISGRRTSINRAHQSAHSFGLDERRVMRLLYRRKCATKIRRDVAIRAPSRNGMTHDLAHVLQHPMRSFERSALLDSTQHRQHMERLQAVDRLRPDPRLFPCDPGSQQTPADASVLTPLSEGLFSADFSNVAGRLRQTSDARNEWSGSPGRIRIYRKLLSELVRQVLQDRSIPSETPHRASGVRGPAYRR